MNKLSITAIVLTFNEELHLQRCLDSLRPICKHIIVVDSYSTDNTKKIAEENKVQFVENKWVNYATQFNWAIDNLNIQTDWILRLDADEYLSEDLKEELHSKIDNIPTEIQGITFPLRRVFLGREIKRGTGEIRLLRLFRTGKGRSENRWMDEHIQIENGLTTSFKNNFSDHNLNNISWWTQKHIGYATREAIDLLDIELNLFTNNESQGEINSQAQHKRNIKHKYAKQPLFLRSFMYFIYRYFIKLGFLEGKEGFLWHFLQGWWYRTLVDVKIYEIKKKCGTNPERIKHFLKQNHNISI